MDYYLGYVYNSTFQKVSQELHFNNSFIFKTTEHLLFDIRYLCLSSGTKLAVFQLALAPVEGSIQKILLPPFTQRHPQLCV